MDSAGLGSAGFDSHRGEGHSGDAFPPKRPSLQREDPHVESDRERRMHGVGVVAAAHPSPNSPRMQTLR